MFSNVLFTLPLLIAILMPNFYIAYKQRNLLECGMPVIGMITNEKNIDRTYFFASLSYYWKDQRFSKQIYTSLSETGEIVVMLDTSKPKKAFAYSKNFMWTLEDNK